jgi:divinyl chlorophyllide a 8-vinyl-reductase
MKSTSTRQSFQARAAILLLSQVLSASVILAFAPTFRLQSTLPSARSERSTLSVATRSSEVGGKPYFVDFAIEETNIKPGNIESSSTFKVNVNNLIGEGKTAVVAGSTGYIGRACVRECVARGYKTIALVRDASRASADEALSGASLVECDVTNEEELQNLLKQIADGSHDSVKDATKPAPVDIVISCLASAAGIESEVYAIDYQATLNLMNAGRNPSVSARHFVLLSAFCCRNPILKLQQAKLEFEKKLAEQSDMTYSIVRPTAFFKSVSGQYESIMQGNSYVVFGDGAVTQCNPIAEGELAEYMCDSALEEYKEQRWGKILNVGGPDKPLTNKMLGEMMFKAIDKPSKFVYVPTAVFDFSISMIEYIAKTWPSQKWEDVLETSKIGKYYAVEDMLTTDEEEKYGKITMMDHFEKIAREGQDPFTPVRATAVISKTIEALPAISISLPVGYGILSKPGLLENVMASSPLADVPILVAGLTDNIIS